ncbi:hypothetical protein NLK61_21125 [Pseudomonas fuscovaginae UPB0736]|nr:hypothetical protein [Pseudomonas fuscovaginae]UUQ63735.1 hypothetical protein NLK61_21125 [Pseudomonas fuscovaginae UPB0736]
MRRKWRSGKLCRTDAQAKAVEVLSNMRYGTITYVWARNIEGLGLVRLF